MSRDAIYQLMSHLLKTVYEDIPENVREITRKCFLDTLGAIVAGSTAPGCQEVVTMIRGWGGVKECTVAGYGDMVPSPNAVWANAMMARSREVDTAARPGEHPDVSAVPAALAAGELFGRIGGKDAITAIVLAIDFNIRLRLATGRIVGDTPWTAGTYAAFISAIVAGKLMKLDESRFLDTLGLAFSQLSNTIQGHREGTLSVRVQNGMGARNGFIAALLAQAGITGPHDILEGRYGYYQAFEQNRYDRDILLADLGEKYYNTDIMIKPYSCCTSNFLAVEAALKLVRQHDLKPEDIESIMVRTNQGTYDLLAHPPEVKRKPENVASAQFNLYYTVACAVVHRDVYLASFTPESIRDPRVLDIAARVIVEVEPDFRPVGNELAPCTVTIRTTKGEPLFAQEDYFPGHPERPMTFDECVAKFKKNLDFSVRPLPEGNIASIVEMSACLEEVEDIAGIIRLMK